jgi:hypothetical protein
MTEYSSAELCSFKKCRGDSTGTAHVWAGMMFNDSCANGQLVGNRDQLVPTTPGASSRQLTVFVRRIPTVIAEFLTGIPSEFTPAQKVRLEEMEKDYQELIRLNPAFALTRRATP